MSQSCEHLSSITPQEPHTKGCEECLKTGGTWMHLRLCLECGHVGCCDSSPGRHATKHYHATTHPIMMSFEPGEDWGYCFVDQTEFDTGNPAFARAIGSLEHTDYLS